ncbi:L-threonine ammonia-lyase [Thiohalophilus thiocyanatoxydans]|uniref:L-threonine dehydratase n=2 Tax=Thiohalophilus thiocyanatoxydans TaxID=381308 RepID=A0A4R8J329_9GAMM|nr:L-threonine ammonia-lyase [Thiohalophilus thiocyanatoxydans]
MTQQYVDMINAAPVYDVAIHSPLDPAPRLSERLANTVLLKREDLQQVFSFKLRGAYNRIIHLSEAERRCGVIAASAGNHAQGVALAAQRLGIEATIVMPRTTPEIKQHAVKSLGATTVLHGNAYDDAYRHAMELVEKQGLTFIHPYDDPLVIAGQGTIGKELLAQRESIDAIFVPVGGGGLIAGIAAYVKTLRPAIKIIGVEPEDAPSMFSALRDDERVRLDQVGIFADGVAVRQVGEEPFRLARDYVDEVILVTTDEICAAIKDIFDDTRSITEPAGALAVAGLKKYVGEKSVQGQTLIAVDSGANMNFDRLRHVAERAELGERRELLFAATIPERPGSFRKFCEAIGTRGITEFNYRYADPSQAHIFVGVQLHGGESEKQALFGQLDTAGYPYMDMTDNEMAKLHIRYMVGGRVDGVEHECLYRFEFPERPGALLRFLNHMGAHWNISLFHYRNHGADYGRVLVGMQVPPDEEPMLQRFLDEIGYRYWDETDNPANALFLSGTGQ